MSHQSTRTRLLQLRERSRTVTRSIDILRARRRALIRTFLDETRDFLHQRRELARLHQQALDLLAQSNRQVGADTLAAVAAATPPLSGLSLEPQNVMGLRYLKATFVDTLPRDDTLHPYQPAVHPDSLERTVTTFEQLAAALIENATIESRLRRLSREIRRTTRIMRILEDRLLPRQRAEIHAIQLFLEERERETQFRLRRFRSHLTR